MPHTPTREAKHGLDPRMADARLPYALEQLTLLARQGRVQISRLNVHFDVVTDADRELANTIDAINGGPGGVTADRVI